MDRVQGQIAQGTEEAQVGGKRQHSLQQKVVFPQRNRRGREANAAARKAQNKQEKVTDPAAVKFC